MARFIPNADFNSVSVSIDSGELLVGKEGYETEDLAEIAVLSNISTVRRAEDKPKSKPKDELPQELKEDKNPNQEDEL